jgi:ribose transport system permease protein
VGGISDFLVAGRELGTFIGVLIIRIVFNGLAIFGVPTFFQYIAQGAILVLAVSMSTVSRLYAKT